MDFLQKKRYNVRFFLQVLQEQPWIMGVVMLNIGILYSIGIVLVQKEPYHAGLFLQEQP